MYTRLGNCWYHLLLPSSRWQTVQNKCNWIPQHLQRSTQSIYINISDTNNIIGGYSIMVLPAQQRVTAVTWIRWTRLLDHFLKCYQTKGNNWRSCCSGGKIWNWRWIILYLVSVKRMKVLSIDLMIKRSTTEAEMAIWSFQLLKVMVFLQLTSQNARIGALHYLQ